MNEWASKTGRTRSAPSAAGEPVDTRTPSKTPPADERGTIFSSCLRGVSRGCGDGDALGREDDLDLAEDLDASPLDVPVLHMVSVVSKKDDARRGT